MKTLLFAGCAALGLMFASPGQAQAQYHGSSHDRGRVQVNVGYHGGYGHADVGYRSGHYDRGYSHGYTNSYRSHCSPPAVYYRPTYQPPVRYCPPPVVYRPCPPVYYGRPQYGCQGW